MTKKCLVFIITVSFLAVSCLCGSEDAAETEALLRGLAEAAEQSAQQQAELEKQAEAQAEAMRAQMEAEMKGEAPPAAPAGAQPAAAAAGPGEIGVPECDEYLKKYPACLESKVPAMAKEQMMMEFKATTEAWKQAAATPGGKETLKTTCKMAMDQAKMAMKIYGCEF